MTRALNFEFVPAAAAAESLRFSVHVYAPRDEAGEWRPGDMAELVYVDCQLQLPSCHGYLSMLWTPDEALAFSGYMQKCAELAKEHRARREGLEDIEEQLRDPDYRSDLVTHVHPDVVYVQPGELEAAAALHPGKVLIARQAEAGVQP